ncbi:MAG: transcription termination factor Rho [Puniceicoccaceae bacterium]
MTSESTGKHPDSTVAEVSAAPQETLKQEGAEASQPKGRKTAPRKVARKTARKTKPQEEVAESAQPFLFSTDGTTSSSIPSSVDTSRDPAPDPESRQPEPERERLAGAKERVESAERTSDAKVENTREAKVDAAAVREPDSSVSAEEQAKAEQPEGAKPKSNGGDAPRREKGEDHDRGGGDQPRRHEHRGGNRQNSRERDQNHARDRNGKPEGRAEVPGGDRGQRNQKFKKKRKGGRGGMQGMPGTGPRLKADGLNVETDLLFDPGELPNEETFEKGETFAPWLEGKLDAAVPEVDFDGLYNSTFEELLAAYEGLGKKLEIVPSRPRLLAEILKVAGEQKAAIRVSGTVDTVDDGYGLLVYLKDDFRIRALSVFIPGFLLEKHGVRRGHDVVLRAVAPREGESCPIAFEILSVMGKSSDEVERQVPFTELTPYYPLERIMLERPDAEPGWDNLSMRIVDLITPIGYGQRGLIVAPPRTGKTVLLQNIANSIRKNSPQTHLMILLVDERPEEVTDFKRRVEAEVISSTFDESAESHVHAAEMVIERARCMVEDGRHVVILLDSITRLARAYNTMMPNSGKILSGGVEANALQKPKRFFGSARNIEGGGSLTILGTALVETGSKMDEVIFEEFKGTGNMELHLDRELANKRVYPALSMDRSGTRKEELLYHPDEMTKVYYLRRAMRGIPPADAMEQLIQRAKKASTNAEFLMALGR